MRPIEEEQAAKHTRDTYIGSTMAQLLPVGEASTADSGLRAGYLSSPRRREFILAIHIKPLLSPPCPLKKKRGKNSAPLS